EQCDLDFRRTGIVGHAAEFGDDLAGIDGHVVTLMMRNPQEHPKMDAPPGPPVRFCSAEPRNCSAGGLLGTRIRGRNGVSAVTVNTVRPNGTGGSRADCRPGPTPPDRANAR